MSELTDRYVAAVAANLPKADRADIAAELRDILMNKIELRECEVGRTLTRKEEEAVLQDYGHPLAVAGRYGQVQHLIGPAIYPFYVFGLKVVLGIIVVIHIAIWLVAALLEHGRGGGALEHLIQALLIAFAVITIVAAALERGGRAQKLKPKWKVSQLPMLGSPEARSPWEVLFEMAFTALATLWWAGIAKIPDPAPSHIDLSLAPVWATLYWPILVMLVVQLILQIAELAAPGLPRVHAIGRMVWHLAALAPLAVLWSAGHWIDVAVVTTRPGFAEQMQSGFDRGFKVGLVVTVLIMLIEAGRAGVRFVRLGRIPKPV